VVVDRKLTTVFVKLGAEFRTASEEGEFYGRARAVKNMVSRVISVDLNTTNELIYEESSASAITATTADLILARASSDAAKAC
jgi:hypothetical protein